MNKSAFNLSEFLRNRRLKKKDFADRIGVSRPTLSRIISGQQEPTIDVAFKIEVATDGEVCVKDWLTKVKVTLQAAE